MKIKFQIIAIVTFVTINSLKAQWNTGGNTLTGTLPSSPNEWLGSSNAGDFIIKTNNTERLRVLSTGNVGIGTTAPSYRLDVFDGDIRTKNNLYIRAVGTGNGISADDGTGTTIFSLKRQASNEVRLQGYGFLTFYTNGSTGTERMRVDGSGNVGIGTTTPGAKLEVAGNIKITGGSPGAGKVLTSDVNGLASWTTVASSGAWTTTGNSGTVDGTNFIGTTDDIPFNIRVNNQKAGRIDRYLQNTFLGYHTGNANTTGLANSAFGYSALSSNTTGAGNNAFGSGALTDNTTGGQNTATGSSALSDNTTGNYNTASGYQALYRNTTGNYNTAVGWGALGQTTTGSYNTAIGYNAYPTAYTYSNTISIGQNSQQVGTTNSIVLGNSSNDYFWCQVNVTVGSDKRIKDDIKEDVPGLAFIGKLRPVTYRYNVHRENEILGVENDGNWDGKYNIEKKTMTGFIAQEVEQAANQIGYNFSGVDKPKNDKGIYGLRYAEFVVPLVKAVQEQQQMIDSLKAEAVNQNAINKSLQQQIDNLISNNSNHSNSINNGNTVNIKVNLNDKNVVVLEQNIPNPFAEQTIINYNLPDDFARAQIIFLDQSGKLIKAVDLTEKGRGILNVFASDLTNGIYTYSLIVDGQTMETKKMIKTK